MRKILKTIKPIQCREEECIKKEGVYIKPLREFIEKGVGISHSDLMEYAFLTFFKLKELKSIDYWDLREFAMENFTYHDGDSEEDMYDYDMKVLAIRDALERLGIEK